MPDTRNLPAGFGATTLAVPETGVADELGRAGMALGDLVQRTGNAVATTQTQLNATAAASATALAETLVDVIAVQEKTYDDQGNIASAQNHVMKLPLVNFIDPVFYQWSNVRLQGIFTAQELAAGTTGSSWSYTDSDNWGQGGLLVFIGGGYNTHDYSSRTTESTTLTTSDYSYGRVRMFAQLEPRRDVSVPKPLQVIQGPRLALVQGAIQDVLTAGALTARTMDVLIEYRRRDGTPIQGKAISIESEGVAWSFSNAANVVTDANGRVAITLRREFLDPDADTTPKDFVLTARIGIIQNSTTITF